MRSRTAGRPAHAGWPAWPAWALWAVTMLLVATFPWLDHLARAAGRPDLAVLDTTFAIPPTLACVSAATVGAMVAGRRPRHPVGWLLLALGLSLGTSGASAGYVMDGIAARPGGLPAVRLVAVYYPLTAIAAVACLGFILLLTPTGSPPSPRWRWWAWVAAAPVVALLVVPLLPGRFEPRYLVDGGPLDFRAFGGARLVVHVLALVTTLVAVPVAAGSLVVRFRRARGVERQQLRWVALAATLTGLAMLAVAALAAAGNQDLVGWVSVVGVAVLPVSIGAAVLRYRLYDLDRIISRALAYAALTLLLGLGYAGVVLLLGQFLGQGSSLAVAGATLALAAAFQPARRRVQAVVDRRFNRRRYDAARTIQAFSARLRQQVDLDRLSAELLAVVDQTMQPERVSVWLRPPRSRQSA